MMQFMMPMLQWATMKEQRKREAKRVQDAKEAQEYTDRGAQIATDKK